MRIGGALIANEPQKYGLTFKRWCARVAAHGTGQERHARIRYKLSLPFQANKSWEDSHNRTSHI
jgi:hypothetical protein